MTTCRFCRKDRASQHSQQQGQDQITSHCLLVAVRDEVRADPVWRVVPCSNRPGAPLAAVASIAYARDRCGDRPEYRHTCIAQSQALTHRPKSERIRIGPCFPRKFQNFLGLDSGKPFRSLGCVAIAEFFLCFRSTIRTRLSQRRRPACYR